MFIVRGKHKHEVENKIHDIICGFEKQHRYSHEYEIQLNGDTWEGSLRLKFFTR